MIKDLAYSVADRDFFAPLGTAEVGRPYAPTVPPAGWTRHDADVWTMWSPPQGEQLPEQGWKVHVSAAYGQVQSVLDVVAGVCEDLGVPFKHLRGSFFYLFVHAKHAHRGQAGKLCALYPHDAEEAGRLLERLETELAGVRGPYVLTDRRFGDSTCVAYRYGAFRSRHQLQADGTRRPVMVAADGTEIPDERSPSFRLPDGVLDPWAPPTPDGEDDGDGDVSFHGYTFEKALQHSNAGGAYRARTEDGRPVFIKEARAHNGYTTPEDDAQRRLQREHLTLRALHRLAPGLAPEPLRYFEHWEHTYLVTELVPGKGLHEWLVANTPLIHVDPTREQVQTYFARCERILRQVEATITRLHDLGYLFGDLSVRNVLVDDDDNARLIDFECTQPLTHPLVPMGTPGFVPPEMFDPDARAAMDPRRLDLYGLGGLARAMLVPQAELGQRNPAVMPHVLDRLRRHADVPDRLWQVAARDIDTAAAAEPADSPVSTYPTPADLDTDLHGHLRRLQQSTADAIEALARPDDPHTVYPTCPEGLGTNTRCVAYGTAGVLHALRLAGREPDPAVLARLRDDSLREHADTPPGLLFGSAGIAWALADAGDLDAARDLLDRAAAHPLVGASATWGGGAAGLAVADLHLHARTGDAAHLERAARVLGAVPDGDELVGWLGPDDASGLAHGRPGLALALGYLARATGDDEPLRRGLRLLRDELRHAVDLETDALGFRVSTRDRRNMPYLYAGAAGFALVSGRYLHWAAERGLDVDPTLAEAHRKAMRSLSLRLTVAGGLFMGQAGIGFVLGDLARATGRTDLVAGQLDSARVLFQHAVPHPSGTRWAGGLGSRISCDLWSGAAGVLVALTQAVAPVDDPLFTLDAASRPATTLPATTVPATTRPVADGAPRLVPA